MIMDALHSIKEHLDQEMFMALFAYIHQLCLSPVMPIAKILAFLMQAHMSSVEFPNALKSLEPRNAGRGIPSGYCDLDMAHSVSI